MANSRRQAQPCLFQDPSPQPEAQPPRAVAFLRSGAFVDNMKLPVHRWFRYSAGFRDRELRSPFLFEWG